MEWVLWMIAVAVLGLGAVAASGRLGSMPGTITDTPRPHLPTGVLDAADLREARFTVVTRGYSMDQVDELLDRLARQLESAPENPVTIRADVEPPGSRATGNTGADSGPESSLSPSTVHGLE